MLGGLHHVSEGAASAWTASFYLTLAVLKRDVLSSMQTELIRALDNSKRSPDRIPLPVRRCLMELIGLSNGTAKFDHW